MSGTLLLVDDDKAILDAVRRTLRREPYRILMATSAEEARALIEGVKVDVLVTDQQMPGRKGSELLAWLRTSYPDVVGIMLSGKASLDDYRQALNAGGVFRIYQKPCNEIDLAVAIREAFDEHFLRKELLSNGSITPDEILAKEIRRLEQLMPGITKVERDESGAITIDEEEAR